jgi:hypothetical protein
MRQGRRLFRLRLLRIGDGLCARDCAELRSVRSESAIAHRRDSCSAVLGEETPVTVQRDFMEVAVGLSSRRWANGGPKDERTVQ